MLLCYPTRTSTLRLLLQSQFFFLTTLCDQPNRKYTVLSFDTSPLIDQMLVKPKGITFFNWWEFCLHFGQGIQRDGQNVYLGRHRCLPTRGEEQEPTTHGRYLTIVPNVQTKTTHLVKPIVTHPGSKSCDDRILI